jgi:hypothetical protein
MDYFLVQFQLVVSSPIDKGELNQTQISVHRIVQNGCNQITITQVACSPAPCCLLLLLDGSPEACFLLIWYSALLVAKKQPELK